VQHVVACSLNCLEAGRKPKRGTNHMVYITEPGKESPCVM
jgi:hypothetical protein